MSQKHKQLPIPPLPPEGISTQVKINRVIDGDTIEVKLERTFHVRLLNYSSPELNSSEGKLAKQSLEEKFSPGDNIHLFIPALNPTKLVDNTTFNRVLAYVYNNKKEPL